MNFVKQGSGKKILVFLHGWGGSWQSWAPIIEKLKKDFTIYAIDLPGFGLSNLPKPYTLSDYTFELYNFINSNKLREITLIGHSFGGQVAIKFALDYPKKISKLVLVDAAVIRNNSLKMRTNIQIAKLGKFFVKNTPLYKIVRKYYYLARGLKEDDSDYLKASNNPTLQKTLANIMREDLSGDLEKIKVPTLIFWGEQDHPDYTPFNHALIIKEKIKNSELVSVQNGGHFSYLDDQILFWKSIKEFV